MARPYEVLERRPVVEDEHGQEIAWYLRQYSDAEKPVWESQAIAFNQGGRLITSSPKFAPLPGSQYTFFECPIFEAMYEGTRGPGKTLSLIMDFAKEVGKGYGNAWRGVMFRQKMGDLDDVVRKIEDLLSAITP